MPTSVVNAWVRSAGAGNVLTYSNLLDVGISQSGEDAPINNTIEFGPGSNLETINFANGNGNNVIIVAITGYRNSAISITSNSVTVQGAIATEIGQMTIPADGSIQGVLGLFVAEYDDAGNDEIVVTFSATPVLGVMAQVWTVLMDGIVPHDLVVGTGAIDVPINGFAIGAAAVTGEFSLACSGNFVEEFEDSVQVGLDQAGDQAGYRLERVAAETVTPTISVNPGGSTGTAQIFVSFGGGDGPGLVTPNVQAIGTVATGTTSLSVGWPASIAANDIAILFATSNSDPSFSTPAGWSSIQFQAVSPLGIRSYWMRCTGSEAGNVALTVTGGAASKGVIITVRGALETGIPFEHAMNETGTSATQAIDPAHSVDGTRRLTLRLGGANVAVAGAPPSGWTEVVESGAAITTLTIDSLVSDEMIAAVPAANRSLGSSVVWATTILSMIPQPPP